ncbi:ABC transporter permease [Reyranella sp. CPCC 100927]|uniref:ABC transporter permease n=1 Tax=Reyranella sp. CPCC 100927 TaxID=2599616 RepID=UPI0011B6F445|nr:ABC transporter permease [Reyranella sp. CPCC 100927]TWT05620.1 ABC transporter permease [Reyranella sp. CPCC 100927]
MSEVVGATPARPAAGRSPLMSLVLAVGRHRLASVGLVVVALLSLVALLAPLLAPYSPYEQDLYNVLSGPSPAHWLGTDNVGRDLLSRLIYGTRISLFVGIVGTLLSAAVGVTVGLIAGARGGLVDAIIMRITDAFLCFPPLIFILAMSAALGPGIHNVILSFALFGWTGFARIIRGQVLLVRELPYVEAARSIGMSPLRIMWRHILPNTLAPIIVAVSISIGLAILVESGVSFLGLGVQPPTASWGKELRVGFTYIETVPLFSIVPGLLIALAVIAFNFIGDGLRDALDPRLRGAMGRS